MYRASWFRWLPTSIQCSILVASDDWAVWFHTFVAFGGSAHMVTAVFLLRTPDAVFSTCISLRDPVIFPNSYTANLKQQTGEWDPIRCAHMTALVENLSSCQLMHAIFMCLLASLPSLMLSVQLQKMCMDNSEGTVQKIYHENGLATIEQIKPTI